MYSYKLMSHPEVLLIDHLKRVGKRCEDIVNEKALKIDYSKNKIMYVAKVMGYSHDLGKSTSFFQHYLSEMSLYNKSEVDNNLKSHALISALITYQQLLEIDEKLAVMAFVAVKRHHGDLDNIEDEFLIDSAEVNFNCKILEQQIMSIDEVEFNSILQEMGLKPCALNNIVKMYRKLYAYENKLVDESDIKDFILMRFLFSVLIYSDKEDAIFREANIVTSDIPEDLIDIYKDSNTDFTRSTNFINSARNSIYKDVMRSISVKTERIMSITVPTGSGKTLTAMSAAVKMKEKLKVESEMKIIYCLPFTSVIDQNYKVYSEVVEAVMGKGSATNQRILKHHHLSDMEYVSERNYYKSNQSKFLIENWNSQIVVTTFYQIFDTLFSNKNSSLVRSNCISNSIILLDEVQAIPRKYWYVINTYFKVLAEILNVFFIFITATQPLIFKPTEIFELVPDVDYYFKQFKRTKVYPKLDPMLFNDFVCEMEQLIEQRSDKNILIIMNTVKSAQMLYKELSKFKDTSDVIFLSTGIVPNERINRIQMIKQKGRQKIVISTQLIEAGVDIDMDIVVRDLAPIDSINQSAGRGNREYRGEYMGEVFLYCLIGANGKPFYSSIYDSFLITRTQDVLVNKTVISEEEFLEINKSYYYSVSQDMSNKESKDLLVMIERLEFEGVKRAFKLIDEQDKVSVFIEIDEKASLVWSKYKNIITERNVFLRKEYFEEIKKDFYSYIINVFKNKVKESSEGQLIYISKEMLPNCYDIDTGYILHDQDVML